MNELTKLTKAWCLIRKLDKGNPDKQALKVMEEAGELAGATVRGDDHQMKDAIGDIFVTLVVLCMQKGWNIEHCIDQAYQEIKARRGKMVDGVFVKEEDL
ncbi:MazG-like family protein [Vagococcus xieshaowenii]|uniref:NTP pyrophosphohydrolase MazG-like domain-containing protein n=1 Tax=Vagococcus xieshaowenii TaxID=2562451 RepID=A0AAJ5EFJ7_9ENTE|nr:MazG-like family protein [Vagococcus xieshaowenii]QCA28235.1 hypothetical protein E4Z98_02480 [Vagococcus xieshaowenii]TFZ41890.1 hypothetical protein E4031_04660 [Vagococcus xieshaowenii]